VAFLGRNCLEFFEVLYGTSMTGAAPVGINWRLTADEVLAVVNDAQPSFLFVGEEFVPLIAKIEDGLESHPEIVVIGDPSPGSPTTPPGADYAAYEDWIADCLSLDPRVAVQPDDVAVLTYTSGTTGRPKAATHTVRAVSASFDLASELEMTGDTVALIATPVFHATAAAAVAMVLNAGGHCVIARDSEPAHLARLIERHKITLTILVPTLVRMILESREARAIDLTSLTRLIYTASPISPDLLRQALDRFPSVRFLQVYGSTECLGVTVLRPEDHLDHLGSAGCALPGVELRVVDLHTGADVADGTAGEVWVRSPTTMAGYWNRPADTAQTITSDAFVRTGDIGVVRDGFLTLLDRAKDVIVSGGENIYPVEIEHVLSAHPTVADVAVVGVPSERWGETVLAVVVPEPGATFDETELIAYARTRLAGYKCPTMVRTLDALPRNASGKVLKGVLREPFWQGHARRIG
jgi:long-chain acyl-CoA synthetase